MAGIQDVAINLRIGGIAGVRAAMGDVEKTLDQMARAGAKSAQTSARARVTAEQQAAKATLKAQEQAAKEALRIRQQINALDVRGAQKAEQDKLRQTEQFARQHEQIVQNSLRSEQRAREQADRAELRSRERSAREAERIDQEVASKRNARANRAGSFVGNAVGRGVGLVGRVAGVAASIGGGFAIADALQNGISEEAEAGQIVRSSSTKGSLTKQNVIDATRAMAIKKGLKAEDVRGGVDTFIQKSGDLTGAMDMLDELSSMSALTGASMADLGTTAGDAYNKIGNKEGTIRAMRALGGQARTGAIDIRSLGEYGPRLTASAARFKGDVAANVGTMGSLAQISVKLGGANNARVGTEAVASLADDIASKDDKFAAHGINVWADKNKQKMLPAEQIIMKAVMAVKGNQHDLEDMFGKESGHIAMGFANAYSSGYDGKKGKAGMQAAFNSIKSASLSDDDLSQGVADKMAETQSKLNVATEEFQRAIQDKLLPTLPGLIDQFTKLIPAISKVVDWLSQDAWHGVGGIVGTAIALEIGKSTISGVVSAAVATAVKAMLAGLGGSSAAEEAAAAAKAAQAAAAASQATGAAGAAGAGEAGALAAGAGGITAGIAGSVAAPVALLAYLGYRANKNAAAGEDTAAKALSMGEGTQDDQTKKLTTIRGLIGRAEDRQAAMAAFNQGREGELKGKQHDALQDNEAAGLTKHLAALKTEAEALASTLSRLNATASSSDLGRADPKDPSRQSASRE